MLQRLAAANGLREILDVALHDVIALHGAERGNIHLLGPDGALVLVAQRNLTAEGLRTLGRVPPDAVSACAQAMATREIVFVRDVAEDPAFAPYLAFAQSVPFTSVLALPLLDAHRRGVGVLSVYSASRFDPTPLELDSIRRYAGELVAAIQRAAAQRDLPALADRISERLLAEAARATASARRA